MTIDQDERSGNWRAEEVKILGNFTDVSAYKYLIRGILREGERSGLKPHHYTYEA
jgi:hypothetical protein